MAKKENFETDKDVINYLCNMLKYVIEHIGDNINGDYYNEIKTIKKCEKSVKNAESYIDEKYKVEEKSD